MFGEKKRKESFVSGKEIWGKPSWSGLTLQEEIVLNIHMLNYQLV